MKMDESYELEEGIVVVENEHELLVKGSTMSEENSGCSSSKITRQSDLKEYYDYANENNELSSQITIEKIDFIDKNQFGEYSDTDPDSRQRPNIIIIPKASSKVSNETLIISGMEEEEDEEEEIGNSQILYEMNSLGECDARLKGIGTTEGKGSFSQRKTQKNSHMFKKDVVESMLSNCTLLPSGREKLVKVDKNDPRCRLHFVKFMKKEGKTKKIWECGICSKEFMHQYTLMRHLPSHTDEKNYNCETCGRSFRARATLYQHKVVHSEDRPYVCDICQKTFSRVSSLLSHKKTHSNEMQFRCEICGRGFHQRGNLKHHVYTHTSTKPYECDLCRKRFIQVSNLLRHVERNHMNCRSEPTVINNKFKCSLCDETFSKRSFLRQHNEYVHGISPICRPKVSCDGQFAPQKIPVFHKKRIGDVQIIRLPNKKSHKEKALGIFIDAIDTKAMQKALMHGTVPFALLKPSKGAPVLVKIQPGGAGKHMLVPASAEELRNAGNFSVFGLDGNRGVQIKVPVVATIHQKLDDRGEMSIKVEPVSDDEDECDLTRKRISLTTLKPPPSLLKMPTRKASSESGEQEGIYISMLNSECEEDMEYLLEPDDDGGVSMSHLPHDSISEDPLALTSQNDSESPSGIQYLRPTENVGEYEVVDVENAYLPTQGIFQKLNDSVTVDQYHLSALMSAFETAGYEVIPIDGTGKDKGSIVLDNEAITSDCVEELKRITIESEETASLHLVIDE